MSARAKETADLLGLAPCPNTLADQWGHQGCFRCEGVGRVDPSQITAIDRKGLVFEVWQQLREHQKDLPKVKDALRLYPLPRQGENDAYQEEDPNEEEVDEG